VSSCSNVWSSLEPSAPYNQSPPAAPTVPTDLSTHQDQTERTLLGNSLLRLPLRVTLRLSWSSEISAFLQPTLRHVARTSEMDPTSRSDLNKPSAQAAHPRSGLRLPKLPSSNANLSGSDRIADFTVARTHSPAAPTVPTDLSTHQDQTERTLPGNSLLRLPLRATLRLSWSSEIPAFLQPTLRHVARTSEMVPTSRSDINKPSAQTAHPRSGYVF
jgi:hypothetical protein